MTQVLTVTRSPTTIHVKIWTKGACRVVRLPALSTASMIGVKRSANGSKKKRGKSSQRSFCIGLRTIIFSIKTLLIPIIRIIWPILVTFMTTRTVKTTAILSLERAYQASQLLKDCNFSIQTQWFYKEKAWPRSIQPLAASARGRGSLTTNLLPTRPLLTVIQATYSISRAVVI